MRGIEIYTYIRLLQFLLMYIFEIFPVGSINTSNEVSKLKSRQRPPISLPFPLKGVKSGLTLKAFKLSTEVWGS